MKLVVKDKCVVNESFQVGDPPHVREKSRKFLAGQEFEVSEARGKQLLGITPCTVQPAGLVAQVKEKLKKVKK
ncbi:hypothetical protein LCGC14_0441250 [marine sediment metagenome]|uniref:Uncharacterized protein n=1 Tax=marine sediment metagenome TaxID=412755 RepID=A0A0F9VUI7_9ZZZZ